MLGTEMAAPDPITTLPALRIDTPSVVLEAEAPSAPFVAPRKYRRSLGMAQTQAGASVVVETVKMAVD
jgi:hypothetical protein